MRSFWFATMLGFVAGPAWAQSATYSSPTTGTGNVFIGGTPPAGVAPLVPGAAINLDTDFLAATRYSSLGSGNYYQSGGVNPTLSLRSLFSAAPISDANAAAIAGVNGRLDQTSVALIGIAARLDRFAGRFREGIALAGSINVLPPNPGDRFAVSFGGAGYDGTGAGSVALSARVGDAIVYGALARGPTQSLVKGGVGWSFR